MKFVVYFQVQSTRTLVRGQRADNGSWHMVNIFIRIKYCVQPLKQNYESLIQCKNISRAWSIYMCVLLWQVHRVYIRGVAGTSTPSAREIRNPSNRTHHRNAGHSQWQHLASRNSLFTSWISLKICILWNHYN